jgi:two-component system sensor histidine kinase UhpB
VPIWGQDPIFGMKRETNSLIGQIVAVNVLLVVTTLFAASAAASLDLATHDDRAKFTLLALTIVLVLLVNMLMLRRRFSPLEQLIEDLEAIDPAQPSATEDAANFRAGSDEVERLANTFRKLVGRIEAERRRSGRLALRAQEEERRRLARDLHDEVNQALTAILLRLQAVAQDASPAVAEELAEVRRLVNQAMEELLRLARQLRPTALDDHGLYSAIESQVKRFSAQTGIDAELHLEGSADHLDADREIAVFRVAQEALANVARHAGATRVAIELQPVGDCGMELAVRDDGRGFLTASESNGLGLNGMAERARLVGGELDILSVPEGGTAIRLRVP